jgi:caffeoyl-CoA O-methyltransferase
MNFLPEKIENYAQDHTSPEDALLNELNRQTNIKVLQPRMLSGHLQGRLLSFISKMIQPKNVLEIGTYTGYSALCLAEGIPAGGQLTTIEIDPEIADFAQQYFNRSVYADKIHLKVGDALSLIKEMNEPLDFVFIDADKGNYVNYLNLIYDKLPIGGYLLADNVLWSGKVTEPVSKKDEDTKVLVEFNKQIHQDARFENILLPIRDGLMLARKIA